MDRYDELIQLRNNLETNLQSVNESEHNEMFVVPKRDLENHIKQVDLYLELVQFADRLETLYNARRKSTDVEEAREIDNDIQRLVNGNERYLVLNSEVIYLH